MLPFERNKPATNNSIFLAAARRGDVMTQMVEPPTVSSFDARSPALLSS
jgi:hypothetical protein